MAFISSPVGADPTSTHTAPQFKLGAFAVGDDAKKYIYALTSGTVAAYAGVHIDEDLTARAVTTTLAATAGRPGWNPNNASIATDTYGWFIIEGTNFQGKLKDGVAVNAALYTSTSAGIVGSDHSTGDPYLIQGVRVATAGSGAGNPGELIAVNPHFRKAGSAAGV